MVVWCRLQCLRNGNDQIMADFYKSVLEISVEEIGLHKFVLMLHTVARVKLSLMMTTY